MLSFVFAEMNKIFMFFINISVQVNQSALLNVWKWNEYLRFTI